jgi:endonuclease III
MKGGTAYSKRIKRLFNKLKRESSAAAPPEAENLVEQLILGILSADASDSRAKAALRQIKESTVDLNDFRVTPPGDMVEMIGKSYPGALAKAKQLSRSLNGIFEREHCLDLSFLEQKGKREAREYLESITSGYAAAWTVLWGIGGHAIPVDEQLHSALGKDGLIDSEASIEEVQSFLERNISASDAQEFVSLIRRYAASRAPRSKAKATKAASTKRSSRGKGRGRTGKAGTRKQASRS